MLKLCETILFLYTEVVKQAENKNYKKIKNIQDVTIKCEYWNGTEV